MNSHGPKTSAAERGDLLELAFATDGRVSVVRGAISAVSARGSSRIGLPRGAFGTLVNMILEAELD